MGLGGRKGKIEVFVVSVTIVVGKDKGKGKGGVVGVIRRSRIGMKEIAIIII